jgi:dihydroxyacid dehydratase/phosphogluconate dehydratase
MRLDEHRDGTHRQATPEQLLVRQPGHQRLQPPRLAQAERLLRRGLEGRPVIGIANTWSELNGCNVHLRALAESVKRGVLQAGGMPFEFPVLSLSETLMKPNAMLFRNLASMDVEESIRAHPARRRRAAVQL